MENSQVRLPTLKHSRKTSSLILLVPMSPTELRFSNGHSTAVPTKLGPLFQQHNKFSNNSLNSPLNSNKHRGTKERFQFNLFLFLILNTRLLMLLIQERPSLSTIRASLLLEITLESQVKNSKFSNKLTNSLLLFQLPTRLFA